MFALFYLANTAYRWILIAAAMIPAVFLMVQVYRLDRLERESPLLLAKLVLAGVASALIALVCERIGTFLLDALVSPRLKLYNVLLYFGIVALSEEGAKYLLLKRVSWRSGEFNCQYDAVVYATFVSLGFALWENISYVLRFGFGTALLRAVTAIPGHTCFGVFMGLFYGFARAYAYLGNEALSRRYRRLAVLVPVLIHGTYDYIISLQSPNINTDLCFVVFIAVLFLVSFRLVRKISGNDRYMSRQNGWFR